MNQTSGIGRVKEGRVAPECELEEKPSMDVPEKLEETTTIVTVATPTETTSVSAPNWIKGREK